MKTLTVVRHAKSSWDFPELSDRQRPLNKRGQRDAPLTGERLKKAGIVPERLISSPAVRAWDTAEKVALAIEFPIEEIVPDQRLYHASVSEIFTVIRDLGGQGDHLMIFGHNPGFTDLVNLFSPGLTGNLPTSGVVSLELDFDDWSFSPVPEASVVYHDYPKKHRSTT